MYKTQKEMKSQKNTPMKNRCYFIFFTETILMIESDSMLS